MMKIRKRDFAIAFTVPASFFLSSGNVDAVLLAGVDFEGSSTMVYDISPDDHVAGDGVTVSSGGTNPTINGWTFQRTNGGGIGAGLLRNDDGARNAGATTPNFPARLEGNTIGSWSITIDPTVTINLERIVFDVRGATGGSGRDGSFQTSLDGNTLLWEDTNLPGRNAGWTNVEIDLSGATYQGLTGQTVSFIWATPNAIDLDTIQVFGAAAVPEPSSTALVALGSIGLLLRRSRK